MDSLEKPQNFGPNTPVRGSGNSGVEDKHHDIFFAAVEATRMPMIVTDPHQHDNPIIFANRAFERLTGYEQDELIGQNCRILQGPETDKETISEIRQAVAEQREMSTEILNYRKDGSTFWNVLFVTPILNEQGDLVYFYGSQLDVSRRRDAEDALRQSQKMEALGQLTGGIAHDFNNLLQVISGYTDIVQGISEKAELGQEFDPMRLSRAADAIRSATDRSSTLTHQLLAFARKQRLGGRVINLNALITSMGDMLNRSLGDQFTIAYDLDENLPNCRIDPTQVEVSILNVVLNARDAMEGGGTITIRTGQRTVSNGDVSSSRMKPGDYAYVRVDDTGVGMPPEVLAHALEPFFTTKEEGKGTGLGLAMVYGFAKQSGGTLEVVSSVGKGTSVTILFPSTDLLMAEEAPAAPRITGREGSETILIVDDRPDVADAAGALLEDFGYAVMTANAPVDAIKLLRGKTNIDLLFTDLIMPGSMNGVMLARAAREHRPDIKILLTTGYAEASLERTDAGGSEFDMLMKPYRRAELAKRVRNVLDGPSSPNFVVN